jgi:hypothetical protein
MFSKLGLDSESGHILVTLAVFATGIYIFTALKIEYGKEVSAAALGSLWTLLQTKPKPTQTTATLISNDAALTTKT